MVYCGKPSKACQACREKKTRCDRLTPSCTQCIRAHRSCPGYRSELDLMFRNESQTVIGKAKARGKFKAKSRSPQPGAALSKPEVVDGEDADEEIGPRDLVQKLTIFSPWQKTASPEPDPKLFLNPPMSYFSLAPTIDERAQNYFNKNPPTFLRNLDLADDICSQTNTDEHLLASMSAVGLASFSNSVGSPGLMVRAQKEYVHALQLTNAALRSPTEVKKDSTLFSVMILSIFETVTGSTERSLDAWAEHVNGASALVKLRGPEQFKTEAGQRMFSQVVSNLLLSCIQRTNPMPEHIVELRKVAKNYMDVSVPLSQLTEIFIDFTVFRSAIKYYEIDGPVAIISGALDIDRRFVEAFRDPPRHWKYRTVYTDKDPHLIWNGNYHVYNEYWMAHVWNGMRICRILLHETIRDQLFVAASASMPLFTDEEAKDISENSLNAMLEMRADILASVPQHTLCTLEIEAKASSLLDGSRSYFVLWPLYLVACMDVTTEAIRDWAVSRLRAIGQTVGIRQAILLADFAAKKTHIQSWDMTPSSPPEHHWSPEEADEPEQGSEFTDISELR